MKQLCVSKLAIIGLDNGLSPGRCQAANWTNAGILFSLAINSSEIFTFSFKKLHLKISSTKKRAQYVNGEYPFPCFLNIIHTLRTTCPFSHINILTLEQNDRHFADDVWKLFSVMMKIVEIKMSLFSAPTSTLDKIMASRRKTTSYYLKWWRQSLHAYMRNSASMD